MTSRVLVVAVGLLGLWGCAHPHEKQLRQVFADARRSPEKFARHFAASVSRADIENWRQHLAAENNTPEFEMIEGEVCNRMYWASGYVIDKSYYVYFSRERNKRRIVHWTYDGGFGEAMGDFVGAVLHHSSGAEHESPNDACERANAAQGGSPSAR